MRFSLGLLDYTSHITRGGPNLTTDQISKLFLIAYSCDIITQLQLGHIYSSTAYNALTRIRLLQSGVRNDQALQGLPPARARLPITPNILLLICANWSKSLQAGEFDAVMIWSAMVTCFFGFFCAGELTVPTEASFDSTAHLAWGDVAVDGVHPSSMIRVYLKRSKTSDQFGQGVVVFLERH